MCVGAAVCHLVPADGQGTKAALFFPPEQEHTQQAVTLHRDQYTAAPRGGVITLGTSIGAPSFRLFLVSQPGSWPRLVAEQSQSGTLDHRQLSDASLDADLDVGDTSATCSTVSRRPTARPNKRRRVGNGDDGSDNRSAARAGGLKHRTESSGPSATTGVTASRGHQLQAHAAADEAVDRPRRPSGPGSRTTRAGSGATGESEVHSSSVRGPDVTPRRTSTRRRARAAASRSAAAPRTRSRTGSRSKPMPSRGSRSNSRTAARSRNLRSSASARQGESRSGGADDDDDDDAELFAVMD